MHYRSSLTFFVFKRQISKKSSLYLQISKPSSHDSKKDHAFAALNTQSWPPEI